MGWSFLLSECHDDWHWAETAFVEYEGKQIQYHFFSKGRKFKADFPVSLAFQ